MDFRIAPLISLFSITAAAHAIDCTKSLTAVEKTICADKSLLELDFKLNTYHDSLSKILPAEERKDLIAAQKKWVKERDDCKQESACLTMVFTKRIETLTKEAQKHEFDFSFTFKNDGKNNWKVAQPQFLNADQGKALNAAVEKIYSAFECPEDCQKSDGSTNIFTPTIMLFNSEIMSVKIVYDSYCCSAYPDYGTLGLTLNVKTGQVISLEDVIANQLNSKKTALSLVKGHTDYKKIKGDCKAPYREQKSYNFYLTDKSVVLFPDFPHAMQSCCRFFSFPTL